jgi:flagellar biosynthesis protein FliR
MNPALAVYTALLLARIGGFVAVAPPFAGRAPRTVRAGLAMALTAFYLGSAAPGWDTTFAQRADQLGSVAYTLALIRETLLGAAMGFAFGLFLLPARIAGEFMTQQVGLAVAPQVGPTGSDLTSALTHVLEAAATMLFLVADGHHVLLASLHASFDWFPLGGDTLPQVGPMIGGLSTAYEMGLLLAGPLALCLFLLAVTMAVMARAAPQLNIYSVGFSLQMLVLLVGGLFLVPDMVRAMNAFLGYSGQTLPQTLAGG